MTAAAAAAAGGTAGEAAETVRARRFELIDARGNTRGILACDADSGAPTVTFTDSAGRTRVTVGIAWNDMPSIQLMGEDGKARVALVARPEGTGMVLVVDGEGRQNTLSVP